MTTYIVQYTPESTEDEFVNYAETQSFSRQEAAEAHMLAMNSGMKPQYRLWRVFALVPLESQELTFESALVALERERINAEKERSVYRKHSDSYESADTRVRIIADVLDTLCNIQLYHSGE